MTDLDRLAAARRVLRRERRRTVDEREAFDAFVATVREIPVEPERPRRRPGVRGLAAGPAAGGTTGPAAASGGVATVRRAYERTVMAVPHYREEYDDTLAESLEVEFGPELAAGLAGHDRLTPRLKRAVLDGADASRTERERFVEALDTEADSVRASEDRLVAVLDELGTLADEPTPDFGAQDAVRARLGVLAERCDAVADDRQATLRELRDRFDAPVGVPDLPRYLYTDLDATYPVLVAVAEVGERATRLRRRVEREIAGVPGDADA